MQPAIIRTCPGTSQPLGATLVSDGVNFSIYSPHATAVTLCIYKNQTDLIPLQEIPLVKIGNEWNIKIINLELPIFYLFQINGPKGPPHLFDSKKLLLDPYANIVTSTSQWGMNVVYQPKGAVHPYVSFDWQEVAKPKIPINELVIYEMHVRGFTQHKTSNVSKPGTFLGVVERIPYLLDLGINAIELMPIQEFNECEYPLTHPYTKSKLFNYWGYSTVNFFAPMQRYASEDNPSAPINEFKTMVRELHRHGIEVILDVVYNHTAEGNEHGPVFSWKGIDNPLYYLLDYKNNYVNFSGCGNTLNCGHQTVQDMILDSLRYWTSEMQVDGFRFDLASILTRGPNGHPLGHPPLIEAITKDPILSKIKLIAEPWDAGGLYQVGSIFPKYGWSEWNSHYRDHVRHFIRGGGEPGKFVASLCGSQNLYHGFRPSSSINFVTAHDGFTLNDLVSYNNKDNLSNGEENRDGSDHNESWNCGAEGDTTNKSILALRHRQIRNFILALMISRGIPMILMGDEYGHTRRGNNNPWCQDNELNWFLWDHLNRNQEFFRYVKLLLQFRKEHAVLKKDKFYTDSEIDWHGKEAFMPNFSSNQTFTAFTFKGIEQSSDLYVAFNAQNTSSEIHLPKHRDGKQWRWVVNTASPSPYDFREKEARNPVVKDTYLMQPFSALLLEAS